MNVEEFSNEFDALLNSYSATLPFGESASALEFDEYEKSVFLTKAQEELIINFYNGKNQFGDSFEKTEEIRRYLGNLTKTFKTSTKVENTGLSEDSVFFRLPDDLWFITYEEVNLKDDRLGCLSGKEVLVIPVTQDEYYKVRKNPFKRPNERKVIRLDLEGNVVELISAYNVESYVVRYLSKPKPIIVSNLPDDLSINEISDKTECELNSVTHRTILERAVRLAIASRSIRTSNK